MGIFVVAFIGCLFRPLSPASRFSFWGEDGPIFTQQPRAHGILHSFFTTYAGYYHLIPRTVAAVAAALPLQWSPPIYALAAYAVIAAVATMAWVSAKGMGLSVPTSAAIAATVYVAPAGSFEIFGTLTNVQWYLAAGVMVFTAAWIGGFSPRVAPTFLVLLVVGLTSPLVITLVPVILLVTIIRRRTLDWAVLVATCGSGAVQLLGAARSPAAPHAGYKLVGAVDVFLVRFVDGSFVGGRLVQTVWLALPRHGPAAAGIVIFVGLLTAAVARTRICSTWRQRLMGSRRDLPSPSAKSGSIDLRRWVPLFLVAQSAILFAEVAVLRSSEIASLTVALGGTAPFGPVVGGRYVVSPGVDLVMAALILLEGFALRRIAPRAHARRFPSARFREQVWLWMLGLWAVVLIANFPLHLHRDPLRTWEAGVNKAEAACRANPHVPVAIPNAPGAPGWEVRLTCLQAFG